LSHSTRQLQVELLHSQSTLSSQGLFTCRYAGKKIESHHVEHELSEHPRRALSMLWSTPRSHHAKAAGAMRAQRMKAMGTTRMAIEEVKGGPRYVER
jgi:hypothetical protein